MVQWKEISATLELGGRRDHKSNHYPPPHPHLLELEEILWTVSDSYRTWERRLLNIYLINGANSLILTLELHKWFKRQSMIKRASRDWGLFPSRRNIWRKHKTEPRGQLSVSHFTLLIFWHSFRTMQNLHK